MDPQDLMYHKLTYGDVLWFTSLCGSAFGIGLNALLIAAIQKTGRRLIYSRLFLVAAVFDLFFSIVEILTQHQIAVKNGVMFLLPRGVEWIFKDYAFGLNYVIFAVHCFAYMQGIFVLPALFRYRFVLAKESHASPVKIYDGLIAASVGALICAISATVGMYQASKRSWNYYQTMIQRDFASKFFLYALDIRDAGTIGYFFGGLLLSVISFVIVILYGRQTFRQPKDEDAKTRVLQAQMTQGLVFRTLTTLLFGVGPVTLAAICVVFRFDAEIFGTGMMSSWPWTSPANALIVLWVIKPFRRYALSLIGANIEKNDATLASPPLLGN
ncbi:hypothetical protein M3Y99_00521600 [Aphelenchoides fujianensis]|nr:hypothetical protein M3Y99_00521600 [Aphelenchoides fujianensis]